MRLARDAPMWIRVTLYGVSWIGCAVMYVPVLYLRELAIDAWDERTRSILRDELDRRELLAYQRSIERERKRNRGIVRDDAAAG